MKILNIGLPAMVIVFAMTVTVACSPAARKPIEIPTEIPTVIPPIAVPPVDIERTLTVQGMERTYFLHIPAGLNNQKAIPLVFVFHGLQENCTYARIYSGVDANAKSIVFVYPNGGGDSSDRPWNESGSC